jgi:hypothetical protein
MVRQRKAVLSPFNALFLEQREGERRRTTKKALLDTPYADICHHWSSTEVLLAHGGA